jgi:hypothetical protein
LPSGSAIADRNGEQGGHIKFGPSDAKPAGRWFCATRGGGPMLFALFYVLAISILIMHFTGFLARHNLEWLILVLAVAVFPAVIYL